MVTWQGRRNLKWHYYYWPSQILWPSASPSWHSMYIKTQPIHQKQAKIFLSMSDSPNASQWSIIENSIQKLEIAKASMVKKNAQKFKEKTCAQLFIGSHYWWKSQIFSIFLCKLKINHIFWIRFSKIDHCAHTLVFFR